MKHKESNHKVLKTLVLYTWYYNLHVEVKSFLLDLLRFGFSYLIGGLKKTTLIMQGVEKLFNSRLSQLS